MAVEPAPAPRLPPRARPRYVARSAPCCLPIAWKRRSRPTSAGRSALVVVSGAPARTGVSSSCTQLQEVPNQPPMRELSQLPAATRGRLTLPASAAAIALDDSSQCLDPLQEHAFSLVRRGVIGVVSDPMPVDVLDRAYLVGRCSHALSCSQGARPPKSDGRSREASEVVIPFDFSVQDCQAQAFDMPGKRADARARSRCALAILVASRFFNCQPRPAAIRRTTAAAARRPRLAGPVVDLFDGEQQNECS